jgi:hypothetical protein
MKFFSLLWFGDLASEICRSLVYTHVELVRIDKAQTIWLLILITHTFINTLHFTCSILEYDLS